MQAYGHKDFVYGAASIAARPVVSAEFDLRTATVNDLLRGIYDFNIDIARVSRDAVGQMYADNFTETTCCRTCTSLRSRLLRGSLE